MIRSPIVWFSCVSLTLVCGANLARLGIDPFSLDVWVSIYSLAMAEPGTILTVIFTRNPIGNPIISALIFFVFGSLTVISSIVGVSGFLMDKIRISRMRKGERRPATAVFSSKDGGKKISGGMSISLASDHGADREFGVSEEFSAQISPRLRQKKGWIPGVSLSAPRFGFGWLRMWVRSRVDNIKDMRAARSSGDNEFETEKAIGSALQVSDSPYQRGSTFGSIVARVGALSSSIAARLDSNSIEKKRAKLTTEAAMEVRRKEREKRAEKATLFWGWVDDLKSANGIEEKIVLAARAAALADMLSAEDRLEIIEMRPVSGEMSMKILESWSNKKIEHGGAEVSSREEDARAFRERLGRKTVGAAVQDRDGELIDRAAMAIMSDNRSGEIGDREVSASVIIASSIAAELSDEDWREDGDETVAAEIDDDIETLLRERADVVEGDMEGSEDSVASPAHGVADSWSSGIDDDAYLPDASKADDASDEIADDMATESVSDQGAASQASLVRESSASSGDPVSDLRAEMVVVERFMKYRRAMKIAEVEAGLDVDSLRDWDASTADRIEGALMAMLRVDEDMVAAIAVEDGFDEATVDGFLGLHADLVESAESVFASIRNARQDDRDDGDDGIGGSAVVGVRSSLLEDDMVSGSVSWDEVQRIRTEGSAITDKAGSDVLARETDGGSAPDLVSDDQEDLDAGQPSVADATEMNAPVEIVTESVDWRKQYAKATALCDALEAMVAGPVATGLTQIEKVPLPGGEEQLAHVFFRIGARAIVAVFLELDGDGWSMSSEDGSLVSAHLGRRILIPAISKSASGDPVSLFVIAHGSGSNGLEPIARVGDTRVVRWPSDDGVITTVMGL